MNSKVVLALLLSFASTMADAADNNRTKKRFGIHAGLLGEPFPSVIGGNLNYNFTSFARLTAGFGSISAGASSASTFGGGVRLLVPSMNFSPVMGASFAKVNVSGSGEKVGGFASSSSHIYISGGLDWQAVSGFNFGLGYSYSLESGIGGRPYVNLGWYF